MSYDTNDQLPEGVVDSLPESAQTLYRKAFNAAKKQYESEETAYKVAWSTVKKQFEKVGNDWTRKSSLQ